VAVKSAFRDAKKGDTILLAPAAASFDQFSSFEERGQAFELEVNKLM
jgi:UDP-N-acetylmuramoylalanine--D-glutamate ligase